MLETHGNITGKSHEEIIDLTCTMTHHTEQAEAGWPLTLTRAYVEERSRAQAYLAAGICCTAGPPETC
jgi:hypothetical protein